MDGARLWLGLEKKEGRPLRSESWPEKKASPSSPEGSRLGSEEKLARASELSRLGDAQWDCSAESSMLTGRPSTSGAVKERGRGGVRKFCRKQQLTAELPFGGKLSLSVDKRLNREGKSIQVTIRGGLSADGVSVEIKIN